MGVFTCLPSFWRACQCVRRYANDKKKKKLSFPQDAFPHLFNLAKYLCGIGYYMTLSMWRINRQTRFQAPFLTFALLNSLYTSIWDVVMDWSLGNPYAKRILLRDELSFRYAWVYYAAIVLDVVVRFNWIFYAIFSNDIQHSAFLSFFVSLSEVFRRGVWSVFRVENEHCANVMKFHASREPTLPYKFDPTRTSREGSGSTMSSSRTSTPHHRLLTSKPESEVQEPRVCAPASPLAPHREAFGASASGLEPPIHKTLSGASFPPIFQLLLWPNWVKVRKTRRLVMMGITLTPTGWRLLWMSEKKPSHHRPVQ